MAKYTFTFSCGHDDEISLVGSHADRERKIAWLKQSGECSVCGKASEQRASKAAAADAGMPALVGTAKQIAWAERIRSGAIDSIKHEVSVALNDAAGIAGHAAQAGLSEIEALRGRMRAIKAEAKIEAAVTRNQTAAVWWIDNRNQLTAGLKDSLKRLVKERLSDLQALLDDQKERAATSLEARQQAAATETKAEQVAAAKIEQVRVDRAFTETQTFEVADEAGSVTRLGDNLTVRGCDGRLAKGFVDGGEWAIYEVGGHHMISSHPEMERVAREAKSAWERHA